jgi:hypothetical protein
MCGQCRVMFLSLIPFSLQCYSEAFFVTTSNVSCHPNLEQALRGNYPLLEFVDFTPRVVAIRKGFEFLRRKPGEVGWPSDSSRTHRLGHRRYNIHK